MDRSRPAQNEVWPADEPSLYVGAPPLSTSQIPAPGQPRSSPFLKRAPSAHASASCVRVSRRTITSVQDPQKGVLQGFCRMSWFAGLRCTRFLRLNARTLECFDGSLRKRLWVAVLDGARVRITMSTRKIVLSKLPVGVVEFYVADDNTCRLWSAALLRASALASRQHQAQFY